MTKTMLPQNVFKYTSSRPGPTIALVAGVHGNESTGVVALRQFIQNFTPNRGTVYVVFANPPAMKRNTRLLNKNLNRCFTVDNCGTTYEDSRARELMKVFDQCEALLDLHAFSDVSGQPFVICEENAFEIATKLNVSIISTNWSKTEPGGTDSYMYSQGKVGICVECGSISRPKDYTPFTITIIKQFLKCYDVIDDDVRLSTRSQQIIRADTVVIRNSKDFKLVPGLRNFQTLSAGEVFGSQNSKKFVAKEGQYIIFPQPDAEIGAEAFTIGYKV